MIELLELLVFLLAALTIAVVVLGYLLSRLRARLSHERRDWQERVDAAREEGRADSRRRARSVNLGQAIEQFVPFMSDFPFNPKDAQFLGSPVDYVVFAGLREHDRVEEVVFVEVKAGNSALSKRERSLKDAIEDGRVTYWVQRCPLAKAEYRYEDSA